MSGPFHGEPPGTHMKKRARSNPNVTCGSCRHFDGLAWCNRWNFHTDAVSPICDRYRPRGAGGLGDVPLADEESAQA